MLAGTAFFSQCGVVCQTQAPSAAKIYLRNLLMPTPSDFQPRAGSGVDKIDPLYFLAGCCKSRLKPGSVCPASWPRFFECEYCVVN